jgi:hypothetical protein
VLLVDRKMVRQKECNPCCTSGQIMAHDKCVASVLDWLVRGYADWLLLLLLLVVLLPAGAALLR